VSSRHGEQFALPEAVDGLHAVRRKSDDVELVISAADPLNLVGILFPGSRIPSTLGRWLVFRRGVPVACGDLEGYRRPLGESSSSDDTRAGLSGNVPGLREDRP
jgi:ATP-dependent Lhr-like helicase